VSGLGDIKNIPASGFSQPTLDNDASITCETGHGYIAKIEYRENNTTKLILYIRLYVVESIVDETGKITGAKIKYQYPFES
jgi:hypothetical protein